MKLFVNRYNGPDGQERMMFDSALALVVVLIIGAFALCFISSLTAK